MRRSITVREHFRSRPRKKTPAEKLAEKQQKAQRKQRKKPKYF